MIGPVEMGALLKKIRLSKNLTLKELASDYLSVSFLSKFERGESDIIKTIFYCYRSTLEKSVINLSSHKTNHFSITVLC